MRSRGAFATAIGVLAAVLVAVPQAAAASASGVQVEDKRADRSRTYTAYTDDTGSIFGVEFDTTVAGEKRRIRGQLEVVVKSTVADDMLVARHAVRCGPVGVEQYEQLYGVQNVERGKTALLKPRYTFTAGEPGRYRCWLWVGSGRPRPKTTRVESNVFTVGWKSFLHASVPVHPASGQGFEPNVPSTLLHKGQGADESVLTWTAPEGVTQFSASGDAYLTTCTSVSGSTDPVTGIRLCEGHANGHGSTTTVRLVVGQLRADGTGYCALSHFPNRTGRSVHISRNLHHVLVYNSGTVPVKTGSGCGRTFKVKVYVKVTDGSSVVSHRQGTLTAALPPG